VHGANRLASNSLMECLVFARQLRRIELPRPETGASTASEQPARALPVEPPPQGIVRQAIQELRELCWMVAGVERHGHALVAALRQVQQQRSGLERETSWRTVQALPKGARLALLGAQGEGIALQQEWHQRLSLAELLMEAALFRQESRGGHFRTDAPAAQAFWQRHSCQQRAQPICTVPLTWTRED
jgi:L-aspartate oxidase